MTLMRFAMSVALASRPRLALAVANSRLEFLLTTHWAFGRQAYSQFW